VADGEDLVAKAPPLGFAAALTATEVVEVGGLGEAVFVGAAPPRTLGLVEPKTRSLIHSDNKARIICPFMVF
jgi:hypothetical protein